jgi:anti-anti-sigma factor
MPDGAISETVVVVTEALEGPAVERWGRLIAEAMEMHPQRLVVDMQDSPLVDAAAIAVLLCAHRAMVHTGGRLILRRPVSRVRRILQIARLDQVFDVEDGDAATATWTRVT